MENTKNADMIKAEKGVKIYLEEEYKNLPNYINILDRRGQVVNDKTFIMGDEIRVIGSVEEDLKK